MPRKIPRILLAIFYFGTGGRDLSWWYHGPRLAFQLAFIWLTLWFGNVTEWPFRKSA